MHPNKISSYTPSAAGKTNRLKHGIARRQHSCFARLNIGHTPRKFPTSMGSHLPLHRISSFYIIYYKSFKVNSFFKKNSIYYEKIAHSLQFIFVQLSQKLSIFFIFQSPSPKSKLIFWGDYLDFFNIFPHFACFGYILFIILLYNINKYFIERIFS